MNRKFLIVAVVVLAIAAMAFASSADVSAETEVELHVSANQCAALKRTYKNSHVKAKKTLRRLVRARKFARKSIRAARKAVRVLKRAVAKRASPAFRAKWAKKFAAIKKLRNRERKLDARLRKNFRKFLKGMSKKQAGKERASFKAWRALQKARARQARLRRLAKMAARVLPKKGKKVARKGRKGGKRVVRFGRWSVADAGRAVRRAARRNLAAERRANKTRTPAQRQTHNKNIKAVEKLVEITGKKARAKVAKSPPRVKDVKKVVIAVKTKARDAIRNKHIRQTQAQVRRRVVATFKPKAPVVRKPQAPVVRKPQAPKKKKAIVPFTWASSSASDDPHWNMWDGRIHDTMVWGWYTWIQSPTLTVQVYTSNCAYGGGPEDTPAAPTCIKRGVIEVRVPDTPMRLVVTSDGYIQEFGTTRKVGAWNHYLEGRYVASAGYVASTALTVLDPDAALMARVSRGSVSFALPRGGEGYGKTNGLMGFLSGDTSLEGNFRYPDGSASEIKSSQSDNNQYNDHGRVNTNGWFGNGRTNGPRVIRWADRFQVGRDAYNKPIDLGLPQAQMQRYWSSAAFKVNFIELAQVSEAEVVVGWSFPKARSFPVQKHKKTPAKVAFCKNLLKGIKKGYKAHFKSCIMDGDFPELSRAIVKTIKRRAKQRKAAKKTVRSAVRRRRAAAFKCGLKWKPAARIPKERKAKKAVKKVAKKVAKKAVKTAPKHLQMVKYHLYMAASHSAQRFARQALSRTPAPGDAPALVKAQPKKAKNVKAKRAAREARN